MNGTGKARRVLARSRDRAIAPLVARFDALAEQVTSRLDDLSRRVADIEVAIQMLDGRAATSAERAVMAEESQARLTRRVEAIEALLADRTDPGPQ